MTKDERITILVAEDNEDLRSLMAALLEREGHRVLVAPDGVRMVRLLAEEGVDALILDVRLGTDDGISLAQELRQEFPDLPIALVSGDSSGPEAMQRAAGLTDLFIPKPLTVDRLMGTVDELIARRRA